MANQLAKIQKRIYAIRGQRVMLDRDLAELYGVELKVMNQAVKRNIKRFPSDFMFQLTDEEWKNQRSQIVTFSNDTRKYKPFAFTEHGILMLSSVLNSGKAVEINIKIMRVFVKMRHYVLSQSKGDQIAELRKLLLLYIEKNDKRVNQIIIALNNLIEQPPKTKRIGFGAD
ncbi:MAG: ORF6N domain-containing protein [Treponema sp.]|nr:ORF6N domain-containing protein [Treponema sp.]